MFELTASVNALLSNLATLNATLAEANVGLRTAFRLDPVPVPDVVVEAPAQPAVEVKTEAPAPVAPPAEKLPESGNIPAAPVEAPSTPQDATTPRMPRLVVPASLSSPVATETQPAGQEEEAGPSGEKVEVGATPSGNGPTRTVAPVRGRRTGK